MNNYFARPIALLLLAGFTITGMTLRAATQSKPASAGTPTNSAPAVVEQEIPKSVFVIPSSPKQGRNPFFPQSAEVVAQPIRSPVDPSMFVLNGITPNGPKRTAMINSRTFVSGESGEVRLPSGNKVMIKCQEIRADSVIIIYAGAPRELKMRFGL